MIRLVVEVFGLRLAVKLNKPPRHDEPEAVSNTAADVDEFGFRPPGVDASTDSR